MHYDPHCSCWSCVGIRTKPTPDSTDVVTAAREVLAALADLTEAVRFNRDLSIDALIECIEIQKTVTSLHDTAWELENTLPVRPLEA